MKLALILLAAQIGLIDASDCPDTWTVFHGSCYLFGHSTPLGFFEAEHFCRQHGGHLVHIDNAIENAFLREFTCQFKTESFWIGLTDESVEGVWIWYDTHLAPNYTDWNTGQPNNNGGNEDCAEISANQDFKWNDEGCNIKHEPLCELRSSEEVIEG